MKKAILAVLLVSCMDADRSAATLRANGFTRIEITGREVTSCGYGDTYCTGFEATGPTGIRVHGAVGCGLGCSKGCTVRIEP